MTDYERHLSLIGSAANEEQLVIYYEAADEWATAHRRDLTALKRAYGKRKNELRTTNEALRGSVKQIVMRSMELLADRLEETGVPDATLVRAIEVGARALGLGVKSEAPPAMTVIAMGEHLEGLAENLVRLLRRKRAEETGGAVINGTVINGTVMAVIDKPREN